MCQRGAVFIPGDTEHMAVNTENGPLRLLYYFVADSFGDIVYRFPGGERETWGRD